MIKSIALVGFLVASTVMATSVPPRMATLDVRPNFEHGTTRKTLRVHYSGVDSSLESQPISIKIYRDGSEVYKFDVTEAKTQPKAYYFALETATAGQYSVAVCADENCSEKNPALKRLLNEQEQDKLTCPRGNDVSGSFVEDPAKQISLPIIKANEFLTEGKIKKIEEDLTPIIKKLKPDLPSDYTYKTEYSKHGIKKNPEYKKEMNLFYASVLYDIKTFKLLFDQKTKKTGEADYTPEICERKYILTANAHLVNKATGEVKYRYKVALHLSPLVRFQYILKQDAEPIHVEIVERQAQIAAGSYEVLVAFCATAKDSVDSTVCSDPIKADEEIVVATEESQ